MWLTCGSTRTKLNDIAEIEKKGPVREWVQMEAPRRHIAKKFHSFLSSFVDDKGNAIYSRRISEMCAGMKRATRTPHNTCTIAHAHTAHTAHTPHTPTHAHTHTHARTHARTHTHTA